MHTDLAWEEVSPMDYAKVLHDGSDFNYCFQRDSTHNKSGMGNKKQNITLYWLCHE